MKSTITQTGDLRLIQLTHAQLQIYNVVSYCLKLAEVFMHVSGAFPAISYSMSLSSYPDGIITEITIQVKLSCSYMCRTVHFLFRYNFKNSQQ